MAEPAGKDAANLHSETIAYLVELRTTEIGAECVDDFGHPVYTNEWSRYREPLKKDAVYSIPKEKDPCIPDMSSGLTYASAMALAWSMKALYGHKMSVRLRPMDCRMDWSLKYRDESEAKEIK